MDRRSLFEADAEAEAEAEGLKISIFAKQIKEHLFIMLLKLVILTLPYNTLTVGLKIMNFKTKWKFKKV